MRFAFSFLLSLCFLLVHAQDEIQWGLQGKTEHGSTLTEVGILPDGDGIFCGSHDSLVHFGPYNFRGPKHRTSSGSTSTSAYIGRVSPKRDIKWVKQVATADEGLYVSDLAIGPRGNIWLSASAEGNIRFMDGSEAELLEMGLLVAKLSPEGDLIWGRVYSGLGTKMHYYHVEPRKDGKCFVLANHDSGSFGNSILPKAGSGQYSQYIGLIDARGKPLWAHSMGGEYGKITAMDVGLNKDGNLVVAGHFRAIADEKLIDERTGLGKGRSIIKTKAGDNNRGSPNPPVMQAFLGLYDKNTGEPIEVHLYGGNDMCNITALKADGKGNIYLGLALYGEDVTIGGKTIPAYDSRDVTMAIVKLNSDWKCVWYKSFVKPKSDFVNDFSLDGNKLYAACLIAPGKLIMDEVNFTASGLWTGAILKMSTLDGYCFQDYRWSLGSAKTIEIRNGEGYAGGWFHASIGMGGERFTAGKSGHYNALFCRISGAESDEPIDSIPVDTLPPPLADTVLNRVAETQHQIEVQNQSLKLTIWDEKEVDGDIISIRFNDEWVVRNYTLSGTPKTFTLKAKAGQINYIEMFAEDVGRIPPATTAMIISDGSQNHKVSLRSTPETNGRIEIQWKPN